MAASRRDRLVELAEQIARLRAELGAAEAEMTKLMRERQSKPSTQIPAVKDPGPNRTKRGE